MKKERFFLPFTTWPFALLPQERKTFSAFTYSFCYFKKKHAFQVLPSGLLDDFDDPLMNKMLDLLFCLFVAEFVGERLPG